MTFQNYKRSWKKKISEALTELSDYDPVKFRSDKYIEEAEEIEQDGKTIPRDK